MSKKIFISYSRREMSFVDDLVNRLEKDKFQIWLDYHALIPGTPWQGQIEKGLNDSDTVVLIVSQASISSKHVELEWRHFIEAKKRVILGVFEAAELPVELMNCEWVDLRGNFNAACDELIQRLKQPATGKSSSIPTSGFRVPVMVWTAFIISLFSAFLSFRVLWTLFIPWILIPLPYQILKRDYNLTQVQACLFMLPFAVFIEAAITQNLSIVGNIFLSMLVSFVLFFLLRSHSIQRWGKPQATLPRFANQTTPGNTQPKSISFYLDHAPQERIIAEKLASTLKSFGHTPTTDIRQARAVFSLISRFKSDTEADPEQQVVFPVIIQTNNNMGEKLSMLQWIDFRPGVRKVEAIAQLLPDPSELLKALGIRPVSSQTVYPPIITAMNYLLIFLGVFTIGSTIKFLQTSFLTLLNLQLLELAGTLLGLGFQGVFFCVLIYAMVQGITTRSGWFVSFHRISAGFFTIALLLFWQLRISSSADRSLTDAGFTTPTSIASGLPLVIYFFGMLIMTFVFLWNRGDIKLWFPAKA